MYDVMKAEISQIESKIKDTKLKKMFHNCFYNTLDTAVHYLDNGDVYVLTGDIPAMWLRDSSASVIQYLDFVQKDKDILHLFQGLIRRQFFYILTDPYANSFNEEPNGHGHTDDEGLRTPYTWERKFELDSLCYPIWLIYRVYKKTQDKSLLEGDFIKVSETILKVFEDETQHSKKSTYYHYRPGEKEEFCIPNHGKGGDVKECGLIWSGYRPSDDACKYGYFIPGNMFVSVVLKELIELLEIVGRDDLGRRAEVLKENLDNAIEKYGTVETEKFGKIYVYETDALGNYLLMDDANVPSLLSIPYFGYKPIDDEIYQNTRKYCLSIENPYYFEGKYLTGIGSPHTPEDYVWHIGVTIEGLTSLKDEDKKKAIKMVLDTDADQLLTHEGISKNDPTIYTRPWFSWSNSLYTYLILQNLELVC